MGAYLLWIHGVGKRELTGEAPVHPLDAMKVLLLLVLLEPALAADGERIVLNSDIDVCFVNARHFDLQRNVVFVFETSTGGAKLLVVNASSEPSGLNDSRKIRFTRSCNVEKSRRATNVIRQLLLQKYRKWFTSLLQTCACQTFLRSTDSLSRSHRV